MSQAEVTSTTVNQAIPIVKEDVHGYILERHENGTCVLAISHGGYRIYRGKMVISNGRFAPKGRRGIVIEINVPYSNDKTSNVIEVHFEDENSARLMKFRDLIL